MDDDAEAQVRRRVGAAIKLRREKRGLTQEQLAASARVSVRAVTGAETGERLPRGTTRRAYEEALGWTDGSIDAITRGGDPVVAESLADLPVRAGGLERAVRDEPDLLPEAKAHLLNQIALLKRVTPVARQTAPDVRNFLIRAAAPMGDEVKGVDPGIRVADEADFDDQGDNPEDGAS